MRKAATQADAACDTTGMTAPRRRRVGIILAVAAAVLAVPTVAVVISYPLVEPTLTPAATVASPVDPLAGIQVAPERPVTGFNRDALFGRTWATVAGCTTRDVVLSGQLEDVIHVAGSTCKVLSGTLHDPYTGVVVQYRADRPSSVQIDHRVPLKEACQSGACSSGWSLASRRRFANDVANLVATTARANESKGDKDPAEWLPADPVQRCRYAAGYVATKRAWKLTVDQAEAAALEKVLNACG